MVGLLKSTILILVVMAVGAGIGWLVARGAGAFLGASASLVLAGLAFLILGFEGYLDPPRGL